MSITVRLAKIGKKNAPAYKIVVSNTRTKRNGKVLDVLGHFNPSHNPILTSIDKDKVNEWKSKGALFTDAVEKIIDGNYEFAPYTRQNENKDKNKTVEEKAISDNNVEGDSTAGAPESQE